MLTDDQIGMITIACCFLLSELLPFISKTDGNGLLHIIVVAATQAAKTLKLQDQVKDKVKFQPGSLLEPSEVK